MKRDLNLENYPNQKPEGPKALNPKPQLPNPKQGRSQVRFQAAASACQPGHVFALGATLRASGLGLGV